MRKPFTTFLLGIFFVFSWGPMPAYSASTQPIVAFPSLPTIEFPNATAIVKGMTIHPDNPLQFDFIVEPAGVIASEAKPRQGGATSPSASRNDTELKKESMAMIKYFLAALTTPERDMWVNLSPYEKNRIVPDGLGQTLMGRDLLAQDYLLKQITASLIHPDTQLGKEFWTKVYAQAQAKFGTTQIPINTFNKVWIMPDKATVWEHGGSTGSPLSVFVIERHLRVMLEEDYEALNRYTKSAESRVLEENSSERGITENGLRKPLVSAKQTPGTRDGFKSSELGSQIIREIVLPALETEVNEGPTFAQLRQIYNSMILATWYKKRLKDSLLGQVYVDQNKVNGINVGAPLVGALNQKRAGTSPAPTDIEKIYQQYLQTFKKGVFNFIKEEPDAVTGEMIPRKYFSGGMVGLDPTQLAVIIAPKNRLPDSAQAVLPSDKAMKVTFNLKSSQPEANAARRANIFQPTPSAANPAQYIEQLVIDANHRGIKNSGSEDYIVAEYLAAHIDSTSVGLSIGPGMDFLSLATAASLGAQVDIVQEEVYVPPYGLSEQSYLKWFTEAHKKLPRKLKEMIHIRYPMKVQEADLPENHYDWIQLINVLGPQQDYEVKAIIGQSIRALKNGGRIFFSALGGNRTERIWEVIESMGINSLELEKLSEKVWVIRVDKDPTKTAPYNSTMLTSSSRTDRAMAHRNLDHILPLEFRGELNEEQMEKFTDYKRYPVYSLPGRRVVKKLDGVNLALRARTSYVMAQSIGFEGINGVQMYHHDEVVYSIEDYWGESLDKSLSPLELTELDAALSWYNPATHDREYQNMVNKFGATFVRGDIYRLFSSSHSDSNARGNMRMEQTKEGSLIRWIDYGGSFSSNPGAEKIIEEYLNAHTQDFINQGRDLLEAIINISDDDIQEVADQTYGENVKEFLNGHQPNDTQDKFIDQVRADFITEAKNRREQFRKIFEPLLAGKKPGLTQPARLIPPDAAMKAVDPRYEDFFPSHSKIISPKQWNYLLQLYEQIKDQSNERVYYAGSGSGMSEIILAANPTNPQGVDMVDRNVPTMNTFRDYIKKWWSGDPVEIHSKYLNGHAPAQELEQNFEGWIVAELKSMGITSKEVLEGLQPLDRGFKLSFKKRHPLTAQQQTYTFNFIKNDITRHVPKYRYGIIFYKALWSPDVDSFDTTYWLEANLSKMLIQGGHIVFNPFTVLSGQHTTLEPKEHDLDIGRHLLETGDFKKEALSPDFIRAEGNLRKQMAGRYPKGYGWLLRYLTYAESSQSMVTGSPQKEGTRRIQAKPDHAMQTEKIVFGSKIDIPEDQRREGVAVHKNIVIDDKVPMTWDDIASFRRRTESKLIPYFKEQRAGTISSFYYELFSNTLHASTSETSAKEINVEVSVHQTSENPILKVFIRQPLIAETPEKTEELWQMLQKNAENSQQSEFLAYPEYFFKNRQLFKREGLGFYKYAKLNSWNIPMHLEYDRDDQGGMTTTFWIQADQIPNAAMTGKDSREDLKDALRSRGIKLAIQEADSPFALNVVRGLMQHMHLEAKDIALVRTKPLGVYDRDLADLQVISSKHLDEEGKFLYVNFVSPSLEAPKIKYVERAIPLQLDMPINPYKVVAHPILDINVRNRIRAELGAKDRDIFIISSLKDMSNTQLCLKWYNELYGHLPVAERPLLIMTDTAGMDGSQEDFKNTIVVRPAGFEEEPFPDMSKSNILILKTRGELRALYGLGDVLTVIGPDKNLYEAADQEAAVLAFQYNDNNLEEYHFLKRAKGVVAFSRENFFRLAKDKAARRLQGKLGREKVLEYQSVIEAKAKEDAERIVEELERHFPVGSKKVVYEPDELDPFMKKKIVSWGDLTEDALENASHVVIARQEQNIAGALIVQFSSEGSVAYSNGVSFAPITQQQDIGLHLVTDTIRFLQEPKGWWKTFIVRFQSDDSKSEFVSSQKLGHKLVEVFGENVQADYFDNEKKVIKQCVFELRDLDLDDKVYPTLALTTPDGAMTTDESKFLPANASRVTYAGRLNVAWDWLMNNPYIKLSAMSEGTIIDIGASTGVTTIDLARKLESANQKLEVIAVDPEPFSESIKQTPNLPSFIKFVQDNHRLEKTAPAHPVKLITMFNLNIHFEGQEAELIDQASQKLEEGGFFVVGEGNVGELDFFVLKKVNGELIPLELNSWGKDSRKPNDLIKFWLSHLPYKDSKRQYMEKYVVPGGEQETSFGDLEVYFNKAGFKYRKTSSEHIALIFDFAMANKNDPKPIIYQVAVSQLEKALGPLNDRLKLVVAFNQKGKVLFRSNFDPQTGGIKRNHLNHELSHLDLLAPTVFQVTKGLTTDWINVDFMLDREGKLGDIAITPSGEDPKSTFTDAILDFWGIQREAFPVQFNEFLRSQVILTARLVYEVCKNAHIEGIDEVSVMTDMHLFGRPFFKLTELKDMKLPTDELAKAFPDAAMTNLGGIDMNANNLELSIKRDESGMPLPFYQQNWTQIHIDGLEPEIIKMEPVNLVELIGATS